MTMNEFNAQCSKRYIDVDFALETANSEEYLIDAAPDLLAALVELLEQLDAIGILEWHGAEGLSLQQALNAISKAKGI